MGTGATEEREDEAKAEAGSTEASARKPTKAPEPFWNSKWFVATLTSGLAIIAASVAPITTCVSTQAELELREAQAHAELKLKEAEQEHVRELAKLEQLHKIRMDYFARAVDPDQDAQAQERILRFLARNDDEPLRAWSTEELEVVRPRADEARREAAQARERERRAVEELERLTMEASTLRESAAQAQRERDRSRLEAEVLAAELASAQCTRTCDRAFSDCRRLCDAAEERSPVCALECVERHLRCGRDCRIGLDPASRRR